MLEALFGNKTIEKILLFLFVNGKCYGTQLHKLLKTPLTPIQKALQRLENGGIIISYFEGKTRLYRFNPSFPLINEVETLLKKAYTLLPPQEKKHYYFSIENSSTLHEKIENKISVLLNFWKKLATVNRLIFNAKSKSNDEHSWNGRGDGEVSVAKNGDNCIIFNEKGFWKRENDQQLNFSNVFRWTLDKFTGVISLEHLRHGLNNPVFLFYLAPTTENSLSSIDAHLYEEDSYFGQINFDKHSIKLSWRIIGPKKNEELDYYYI